MPRRITVKAGDNYEIVAVPDGPRAMLNETSQGQYWKLLYSDGEVFQTCCLINDSLHAESGYYTDSHGRVWKGDGGERVQPVKLELRRVKGATVKKAGPSGVPVGAVPSTDDGAPSKRGRK